MRRTLRALVDTLGLDGAAVAREAHDLDDATPWYVTALAGFGTWVGAMLVGVAGALSNIFGDDAARAVLGALLLALAPVIARLSKSAAATQAALICVIAGEVLFFSGIDVGGLTGHLVVGLVVELYVIGAVNRPLTRGMATLAALSSLLFLLHEHHLPVDAVPLLAGVVGVVGFLGERRWLDQPWSALVRPIATACVLGWLGFWTFEALAANFHEVRSPFSVAAPALHAVVGAVLIVVTAVVGNAGANVRLSRRLSTLRPQAAEPAEPRRVRSGRRAMVGVVVCAVVGAALSLSLPGFVAAFVVVGVGVACRARLLTGLAVAFALFFLWLTYWRLDVTLLQKALWSSASGVLLFVVRAAVGAGLSAPLPSSGGRRVVLSRRDALLAAAGAGLFVVVMGGLIISKEQTLSHGRRVLLPLVPRDPRSLAQGDYMALRTALAVDVRSQLRGLGTDAAEPDLPDAVVVHVDADDVGTLTRLERGARDPIAADEVRLRVHGTANDIKVGAEDLFFPEGDADRFARARYGEVRVDDDGDVVLVGLCDADRQPL